MTKTQILLSGHGGQGVLLLGDCIAYSAVLDGRHVVCTPSYGPETRGGKARCYVVISDDEIDTSFGGFTVCGARIGQVLRLLQFSADSPCSIVHPQLRPAASLRT